MVADTMTQGTGVTTDQSAGPGYNNTEDRDELTKKDKKVKIFKVNMSCYLDFSC